MHAPPVIFLHPCDRCHHTIRWADGRPEPHDCNPDRRTPVSDPAKCPECRASKHRNCDGRALDNWTDEIVACECDCKEATDDHA